MLFVIVQCQLVPTVLGLELNQSSSFHVWLPPKTKPRKIIKSKMHLQKGINIKYICEIFPTMTTSWPLSLTWGEEPSVIIKAAKDFTKNGEHHYNSNLYNILFISI